jgi:hypothetical protein
MDASRIAKVIGLVTHKNSRRAVKAIGVLARHEVELSAIEALDARDDQREFQKSVARIVVREGILGLIPQWDELGSASSKVAFLIDAWRYDEIWLPEIAEVTAHALKDAATYSEGDKFDVRGVALTQLNRPDIYQNATLSATTRRMMIPALLAFLDSEDPVRVEPAIGVLARVAHMGDAQVIDALHEVLARSGKARSIEVTTYSGLSEEQRRSWEDHVREFHPDKVKETAPDEFAESQRRHLGRQHLGEIAFIPTGIIDAGLVRKAIDQIAARQPY